MRYRWMGRIIVSAFVMGLAACGDQSATEINESASAPALPNAMNMELVGHHDLQTRWSYQPVPHRVGDRWILFVGHHAGEAMNPLTGNVERNGMSILDVTDPAAPVLLHHSVVLAIIRLRRILAAGVR